MPAQKSAAKQARSVAPAQKRTTKATKPAASTRKRSATQSTQREGFLDAVVDSAKDAPSYVAHQAGQVAGKVAELASAAAKKTGTIVSDVADTVGLGSSKKTAAQRKRK